MCGRYLLPDEVSEEELEEIIAEVNRRLDQSAALAALKTRGEVFPTDTVPVLSAAGPRAMRWGFARPDGKGHVINARAEGLLEKPMFRGPALAARCLVPAAYYFEWERRGRERLKYRLRPRGGPLMYMAAVWREERGTPLPAFSIVTREAAPDIAFIHDRMPVMLAKAAREAWLAPNARVEALLEAAEQDVQWQPDDAVRQMSLFP